MSALSLIAAGCALFAPLPAARDIDERLQTIPTAGAPVKGRVVIHWNEQQVPFIEASNDEDAAFALGLAHAHLRLGQMELYRRVARGRIAEMAGPIATDIDHGLRILNFARAAEKIETTLPPATRAWMEAYVAGINHYITNAGELPHEYRVLGLKREPWTIADSLAFGRLAGTDVNWLVWANLLRLRQRDDWPEIWARLIANGSASTPSFKENDDLAVIEDILTGLSRSGSNSLAVAPARTTTGGAIMANDPHLGIFLPNIWLLAGIKSPSYHAIGLMVPGLPFFGIGRNPSIAWGGTNMRAAASDLIDIAGLDPAKFAARTERIKVRWWFDRTVQVRETDWGPVISDAPFLAEMGAPAVALKWTGHERSDEITAFLVVQRARNFVEFRDAFKDFAVPGQNMLYADSAGNIGQVMAVRLPRRNGEPPSDMILTPTEAEAVWADRRGVGDLPFSYNPDEGFLASANNKPANTRPRIGFFFSPDDRVERMATVIRGNGKIDMHDVMRLQRDVYMSSAARLRDRLVDKIDAWGLLDGAQPAVGDLVQAMRDWDGTYDQSSEGALAFELFRAAFESRFLAVAYGDQDWAAFANVARIKSLLAEDIEASSPEDMRPALEAALAEAAAAMADFRTWGDMHRLGLAHPMGLLPVIGGRYRFGDYPIGGSTDTLMKTAHGATMERHRTRYGSNARHISDMTDPDENYFVILGGQDGWFNSATFVDQVPLWLAGDYIRMPLRLETVRETFKRRTELAPPS